MRIHCNEWNVHRAIWDAVAELPGVYHSTETHGSRSHAFAIELSLEGNGNARKNSGRYGASDEHAATWDEWGVVLAAIYKSDPTAVCGGVKNPTYRDYKHFHWSTGYRFLNGKLPADTHPRHLWEYDGPSVVGAYNVSYCRKCSATWRCVAYGHSWDEVAA